MGNCQTTEAAAVVIQHPPPGGEVGGGRIELAHGALSAAAVMAANPGHYVAAVIPAGDAAAAADASSRAAKKRRLKLLRPDDTLALGGVYRLVSFEKVLREFVSKRHATLLSRAVVVTNDDDAHRPESEDRSPLDKEQEDLHQGEETEKLKRPVGRRAILHRRHQMEMMGHLNSKQGTDLQSMANKAPLPSPDQTATSSAPDPTANCHRPSDPEPDFGAAALVMLGGRLGLARHGQWRPTLPSIAEGSAAC